MKKIIGGVELEIIETAIPVSELNVMSNHFEGLEEIPNDTLYETFIGNLIDRYLHPEYFTQEDIDEMFELCGICHKKQDPDGNCGCTNPDSLG